MQSMSFADQVGAILRRARRRILADRATGVIKTAVRSFRGLHRYVDANAYLLDSKGNVDPWLGDSLAHQTTIWNAAIGGIDQWLADGALKPKPRKPSSRR